MHLKEKENKELLVRTMYHFLMQIDPRSPSQERITWMYFFKVIVMFYIFVRRKFSGTTISLTVIY